MVLGSHFRSSVAAVAVACVMAVGRPAATVGDPQALLDEGVRHYAAEDYKKAVQSFEKLVAARPKVAEYHLWLGRASGRRADNVGALRFMTALSLARQTRESFERAVEIDPSSLDALWDLFDFYVQAPGMVGGGLDKAEGIARRLATLSEGSGERAWAEIESKNERYGAAENRLRKARELEPDEVGHVLALASFLSRRGRYDESEQIHRQAREKQPDSPGVWLSEARSLIRANRRPREARALLERYLAADLDPNAEPRSTARKLLKEL